MGRAKQQSDWFKRNVIGKQPDAPKPSKEPTERPFKPKLDLGGPGKAKGLHPFKEGEKDYEPTPTRPGFKD